MSQAALSDLLAAIQRDALNEKDPIKKSRFDELNMEVQIFRIGRADLYKQLVAQLEFKQKAIPEDAEFPLRQLSNMYYRKIATYIRQRVVLKGGPQLKKDPETNTPKAVSMEYWEDGDQIFVRAYSKTKSNFNSINDTFMKPGTPMRALLDEYLAKAIKVVREAGGHNTADKLFQLGHESGANADYYLARRLMESPTGEAGLAALKAGNLKITNYHTETLEEPYVISAASKFLDSAKDITKTFEVGITLESASVNQSKAKFDKQMKDDFINKVKWFAASQSAEFWAEHPGSDSVIRRISKELMLDAAKFGAKVTDKSPVNKRPSKVVKRRKIKVKANITNSNLDIKSEGKSSSSNYATPSYISLIAIINEKLPPQIRKNMGTPRLNNRTGRLSESARVTNILQTPQGMPSIEYTYDRSPYDVFDRRLGKSPWNTPARDPSELVSMSIRQIAMSMGIGRFYTRRAE